MERLVDSIYTFKGKVEDVENDYIIKVQEKLKYMEDKEEQGLLIELPCKVGKVVFCIFERRTKCTEHNHEFDEYSCQGCECLECDSRKEKYVHEMKAYSLDWIIVNISNFGKTVFFTRSEAEEALAKMGGK
jgi:hypothetical protein